jgi:hypothetical protein
MGGAWCNTYGTQMATRVLASICISPALGIGGAVATELFFSRERAQKLGWWTLMTTLGTPGGPFIMGFVVQHLGVRWIFWILAIINMCQFIGYVCLGGESLYRPDRHADDAIDEGKLQHTRTISYRLTLFQRIDPSPVTAWTFLSPFQLTTKLSVIVPACAYAVVFSYANIALIVEMPILFGEKFHLNAQQIGLQYIALIIGSVIGEQVSGPLSDWAQRRSDRALKSIHRGHVRATHRLWFSYVGFATVIGGLLIWGIRIEQAAVGAWNVTPLVGAAIAAFGNQVITTTLIAYAVDCHRDRAMDIGVLINLIRQVWGFVGPFYMPLMFESLGFSGSAGLMVGIVVLFALLPILGLHWFASKTAKVEQDV